MYYSSRTRSLFDAVYDWSRFASLPQGYNWIREEVIANRVKLKEIVEMTILYGNQGTARRIGFLIETLGAKKNVLEKLEKVLTSKKSQIPFVPGKPKRGKLIKRWGVVVNEQI